MKLDYDSDEKLNKPLETAEDIWPYTTMPTNGRNTWMTS